MNLFISTYKDFVTKALLVTLLTIVLFAVPLFIEGLNDEKALAVVGSVYNDLATQAVRNNYDLYKNGTSFSAYDAYILSAAGADIETWTYDGSNVKADVIALMDETIADPDEKTTDWLGNEVYAKSASRVAREYLAAESWGETDRAENLLNIIINRQTASGDGSIDGNAFSDLAAFEALGRAGVIDRIDTSKAISYILANQDTNTGAWTSSWNDFMATAQAVRTLEYLKSYAGEQATEVQAAIDSGLAYMKSMQQPNGSLQKGAGGQWPDDPVIDTAEAIYTLDLLGIDPATWESEAGKTPVDYMLEEALNDDGTFGSTGNLMDNTWAIDAYLKLGASIDAGAILGIKVTPESAEIIEGETQQYTAIAYQFNGTTTDISNSASWSTGDTGIATVNDTGLVTGVSSGETVVTAIYQGINGSGNVNVTGESNGGDIPEPNSITVEIEVIGKNNDVLFGPDDVTIYETDEYGFTALGALDATGLHWEFSDDWDYFIEKIGEYRNQGLNGWMYKVNDEVPTVLAHRKTVRDGDEIIWWYSTDEDEMPGVETSDDSEDIIDDPDANDSEVADAVNELVDNLDELDDIDELISSAGEAAGLLEKALARIESEEAITIIADNSTRLLEALSDSIEKAADEETRTNLKETTINVVDTVLKIMEKLVDESKLDDVTNKLIESASELASGLSKNDAAVIKAEAVKVAEKAIEKAGTDRLEEDEITVEGNKAKAEVNLERLVEKITKVINKAEEMDYKLRENAIESNKVLQKKVAVEVPVTNDVDEIETNIPSGVISTLAENEIDMVEIRSEIADFGITSNTFGESAKGKDISLSAKRVNRQDLPEAVRNEIPDNSTVVDLNAAVGGEKVNKFNEPVEVAVAYTLKEDDDPETISVFLLKEDGTIEPVGGKYDPITGKVRFKTNHFSKYFAKAAIKEFADLDKYPWAEEEIQILAGKGIINGRSKGSFEPAADITRAEFSALLVRMLKLDGNDIEIPFKDVVSDAWYSDEVAAAYASKIVNGKSATEFDPNGKITRQEVAVMITRVLNKEGYKEAQESELDVFSDASEIAPWAKAGVAMAVREEIVNGMGDGTFAPQANASRAQAAVILYRLFIK